MASRSAPSWLEGTPDWAWPGLKSAVVALEVGPAAWVPALPRVEPPPARVAVPRARPRTLPRPLRLARLMLLIAVAGGTFVVSSGLIRSGSAPAPAVALHIDLPLANPFTSRDAAVALRAGAAPAIAVRAPALPTPVPVSTDRAGATIASITYRSVALGWRDRFLVYLPPGYRTGTRRYPVLYLLHGDNQPAASFLRLGLAPTLDRLIATHAIAPMIAVMLQGAGAPANWEDTSGPRYYDYVSEVQRLTDRVLRTIPSRAARGIAGYSMGGFGAMNVALRQLGTYSLVESWEGQFANLSSQLAADRPLLAHLPLSAFVWGGAQDTVVGSALDAPWAAAMRAAGAHAASAIYPGTHAFAPIQAHLAQMLSFAGRALAS